jgi:hypothetical protein
LQDTTFGETLHLSNIQTQFIYRKTFFLFNNFFSEFSRFTVHADNVRKLNDVPVEDKSAVMVDEVDQRV